MLDDIALFIHVVQQGSLSSAASYLSLPSATVTRRLQKLEQKLGCQLMHRSARRCLLTQEGEVYYKNYADLVEQFEQTQHRLSSDISAMSGKLKVLAPMNISHVFLRQMWIDFARTYPDIQLDLVLSNQMQDMIEQQADIAIRSGPQPDSSLYQQKLGDVETILVAAPSYLEKAGLIEQPQSLKEHRIIGTELIPKWSLVNRDTSVMQEIFPRFSAMFNDTSFVRYLVSDGQGISLLPTTEVAKELRSGELVRILPDWRGETRTLYVVWPSGRLLNEKAKCLREFLRSYVDQHLH